MLTQVERTGLPLVFNCLLMPVLVDQFVKRHMLNVAFHGSARFAALSQSNIDF